MTPSDIVFDGALWLAVPIAIAAGLLSFLSPCVLPLVPGYLGYVSGVAGGAERRRSRMVLGSVLFVLGFSAVFLAINFLGASAARFFLDYSDLLQRIGGAIIIVLGFVFIGQVSFLQRTIKPSWQPKTGLIGAPLLGIVFALGWTPCLGPTIATILPMAGFDPGRAVLLAAAYCLGLGIPFVLVAIGFGWVGRSMAWVRRHIRVINIVGGILLIVVGLLLVTGLWNLWLYQLQAVIIGFVPAL